MFVAFNIKKNSGLSNSVIISLFLIKIIAGCINLYIHNHEFVSNDITYYYWQSVAGLRAMPQNPIAFFKEWLFNWGDLSHHMNLFKDDNLVYWSDLGRQFHYKFMTLANILTIGYQYVNVIIFNVFFFLGQFFLYKTFYRFQNEKKWLFVAVIFLIPSVLFWCGGIHKDGWILASIGFSCYFLSQYLNENKPSDLIAFLCSLCFLFVVRYFYFFIITPVMLLWIYSAKSRIKPIRVFGIGYLVFTLLFFLLPSFIPALNPMNVIAIKQQEFLSTLGYSDINTPILEGNIGSFIKNLPPALDHILLQPHWSASNPLKYDFASADSILVLVLIIVLVIFTKKKLFGNPFPVFILFISITMYLFIGYVMTNCGALVRYKSEFTALLLASLISLSELPFINKLNGFLEK